MTSRQTGALAAIIGSIAYLVLSALHGDPPIDDPARMLDHVAARPWWHAAHLANILAVLLWLAAVLLLTRDTPLGRLTRAMTTATTAVYAIYFSIHGFGFSALAERWGTEPADPLLTQTDAVLTLLGSAAFTAQAMLGLSILLLGLSITQDRERPRWFGPIGVLAGAAWLVGAVLITFMVIVPATVLACVWLIAWGALSLRPA